MDINNTNVRLAWLAGLFDADGTFCFGGKEKQRTYLSIELTDLDILERCADWFGGSLYGPYQKNAGHNVLPMYSWRVQKTSEVWPLLDSIYPLLSKRRKNKIDECRLRKDQFVDRRYKNACMD